MPDILPVEKRMNFFVYIIESPSPLDLYHQRSEGGMLQQMVRLNQVGCVLRLTVNSEAFKAALDVGLQESMKIFEGAKPIIHISAHGSTEGIQLSSNEFISWPELRELLIPINKQLDGSLIVCMSTCNGYSGCRMAMHVDSPEYPFFALIGNGGKPTWPETAIGFATLYHLIKKGYTVINAVEAMCTSSGNNQFYAEMSEESKQGYLEYIRTKKNDDEQIIDNKEQSEADINDATTKYKLESNH